ncbi:hypothetical protein [Photobacterium galatheae]|uniref:Uncharacterized protein n=1 Tax=Photobacterium galatheae TaxID=1654360 RepID=A0A066RYB7_9GAMM|nr:hypothetical protein [Photobacterium galatheae]KDM92383.1 hypothetical protein EA58_06595 [Photobacterium galatheae]MCM0150892.1 hypothetical protein [Photobacterium galatheae]
MKQKLGLALSLSLVAATASASDVDVNTIQGIQCDIHADHCQLVLEKPISSTACLKNAVVVPAEKQQLLSVLSSAMFTGTQVKVHFASECVNGAYELQTFDLVQ